MLFEWAVMSFNRTYKIHEFNTCLRINGSYKNHDPLTQLHVIFSYTKTSRNHLKTMMYTQVIDMIPWVIFCFGSSAHQLGSLIYSDTSRFEIRKWLENFFINALRALMNLLVNTSMDTYINRTIIKLIS